MLLIESGGYPVLKTDSGKAAEFMTNLTVEAHSATAITLRFVTFFLARGSTLPRYGFTSFLYQKGDKS
jgi:hypothetical protein